MPPEPTRPEDWPTPVPAHIPHNTYWPFLLSIGIVLSVWAPALLYMEPWVVVGAGVCMTAICIGGWVREILRDWRAHDEG